MQSQAFRDFHTKRVVPARIQTCHRTLQARDEPTQRAAIRIIDGKELGVDCRIRHACLVGYDWSEYKKLPALMVRELSTEFRKRYDADRDRLHGLVEKHFAGFDRAILEFEIFFLPFTSAQDFRDAFYKAV